MCLLSGLWRYIMVEHKKKFAIEHAKVIRDQVKKNGVITVPCK